MRRNSPQRAGVSRSAKSLCNLMSSWLFDCLFTRLFTLSPVGFCDSVPLPGFHIKARDDIFPWSARVPVNELSLQKRQLIRKGELTAHYQWSKYQDNIRMKLGSTRQQSRSYFQSQFTPLLKTHISSQKKTKQKKHTTSLSNKRKGFSGSSQQLPA